MAQLAAEGHYTVPEALMEKLRGRFTAFRCDDAGTKAAIKEVWQSEHYLMDTHTAVGWRAARDFGAGPTVILSTASPYKFPAAVLSALGVDGGGDEFSMMDALEALTGVPMPANLRGLRERPVLHRDCVAPADMRAYVERRKAEPSWAKE